MTLRHLAPAPLIAVAILACTPSVPSNPNTSIVTAEFNPATSTLPLPNSLAISPDLNPNLLAPRNAQEELLGYFLAQGGFPPDQVLPLTFPISTLTVNGPDDVTSSAPDIDLASVVPCTGLTSPGNCNLFVFDALAPADEAYPAYSVAYAKGATSGSLSVTPGATTATTWRPGGLYFYALRGGASGIKTTTAIPLQPSSTTYTLIFGQPSDFTCPSTSPDCALKALKTLQTQYQPVFATIENKGFPLGETVVVGTFSVAPATTWVVADPGSGVVPVPSDFMLDPNTNRVSLAAATAFGLPPLATLDGFSTTGMDIAQTYSYSASQRASEPGPISAGSVRASSGKGVFIYKVGATTATELTGPTGPYAEPPPITVDTSTGRPCTPVNAQGDYGPTCVSTIIGIQPAVTVPTALGPLALPPYEERTEYAVIVTNRVTDPAGIPLSNTTLGQMLLFTHPLCTPSPTCAGSPSTAVSAIPGVSGAQASLLESMRLRLQPVVSQLASDHGVAKADIVMPYTFRTQSITGDALQLGAGPYALNPLTGQPAFPDSPYLNPADPADPLNPRPVSPAAMAKKWGLPAIPAAAAIATFVEATVLTFDKLDPKTGAFDPVPANGAITPLPTIIAIPAAPAPSGGYPLAIFHHGLGRSRGDSLLIAGVLASQGIVVAAIDAAKHGARSWCTVDTTNPAAPTGCATGVACDTSVFAQQQGDPDTGKPGLCVGALAPKPLDATCAYPTCWDATAGNAYTSGLFFTGLNLFRWRDSTRQDILDQSMLVRVLRSANGSAVISAALGGAPFAIDPSKVFYVGQSVGSIEGTINLAANPYVSRAALNVGGGTWIDIMTTSPAFRDVYVAGLDALGIAEGSAENLLFLIGAKWILDPADPINFARHLTVAPLPNVIVDPTGQTPQAPKAILGQAALCDDTVPNPASELLYGTMGLAPLNPTTGSDTPGLQWYMASGGGACPADGISHGFLLDWTQYGGALAQKTQLNVASFLLQGPVSRSPVTAPFLPVVP